MVEPTLLILPAVHGFLIVLTAWLQSRTNWGYYRLIGVDFLAVPLAMCCGDPSAQLFGIFFRHRNDVVVLHRKNWMGKQTR
jgi:hypothetical protein